MRYTSAVRAAIVVVLVSVLSALAPAARAQLEPSVHGRLDHDMVLTAAIGGGVALNDRLHPDPTGSASIELRARLIDMAGLMLAAEWRAEGDSRLILAADVRPLFLARWILGGSLHRAYLDLLLDSIGIDLGAAFGPLDDDLGVALVIGFGLDVPLYIGPHADGLFLRLGARHVTAGVTDQSAPRGGTSDWLLYAALGARFSFASGIASWEPERYEVGVHD